MARRRAQRAGKLIQEEVSKIIQGELKDPRIGFVTVTGVDVTDDLCHARVFITVLAPSPEDESRPEAAKKTKKRTLDGLEHAKGFIRKELGHRIKLRVTPEIEFRFDESTERGIHIEQVLKKIREKEE